MGYYGQGDFYRRGDFFKTLGGVLVGAAKVGLGVLTGGATGGVVAATSLVPKKSSGGLTLPSAPPSIGGGGSVTIAPDGSMRRKRRRMNVTNPKALNRANRRVDGFVRVVKKSLKHTPYQLTRKGSGRGRKPSVIVETGPGSVNAR